MPSINPTNLQLCIYSELIATTINTREHENLSPRQTNYWFVQSSPNLFCLSTFENKIQKPIDNLGFWDDMTNTLIITEPNGHSINVYSPDSRDVYFPVKCPHFRIFPFGSYTLFRSPEILWPGSFNQNRNSRTIVRH